jgi:hypothetical protein
MLAKAPIGFGQMQTEAASSPVFICPEVLQIATGTEASLPVRIEPENGASKQSMLLIRGLPSTIVLSKGRLFESGVWAIQLTDLPELSITTLSDSKGQEELELSLVNLDGTVLAARRATLVFVQPLASTNAEKLAPTLGPIGDDLPLESLPDSLLEKGVRKELTDNERESVLLFMQRGDENMETGKVNIARLFYRRAADLGWSPGALALGKTYDVNELSKMTIIGGVQPDMGLARKWYMTAQQLGSAEASEKLQQLTRQ